MNNQSIIVIYLANPNRMAELSQLLSASGMMPVCVENTDKLHAALNGQRLDLLIIENKLPGFLTGLEILERMHAELLRPASLLLGQLSSEEAERARTFGVMGTAPSSISLTDLAETARRSILSPQNAPVLPIPLEARRLVQACDSIQPLPQVLIKISAHIDHERASTTELANDIAMDARLTAMLLRLINSTKFGLRTKLTKVNEAVNYLGIRRTVSLVISAYLIRAQSDLSKSLPESLQLWHQRRSVLIASTAAALASRSEGLSVETAYVMGLLQDFGILLMAQGLGARYVQLIERIREVGQLRLDVLEKKDFGVTHAEVSAALLQKWGLPPSFIPCVLYHHPTSDTPPISTAERRFLSVMRVGEALANVLDHCSTHRNQVLNRLLIEGGFGTADDAKACLAEAVAKTVESSQLFSIPAPDPQAVKTTLEKIAQDMQEFGEDDVALRDEFAQIEPEKEGAIIPAGTPFALIVGAKAGLVDDVSRYLTAAGIWPVPCSSTVEARYLSDGAQAVLCDLTDNAQDLVQFVRQLRTDGFQNAVIAMSEVRSRQTIEAAVAAGISGFLCIPFTKSMLLEKLGISGSPGHKSADPDAVVSPLQGRGDAMKSVRQTLRADR